MFFNKGALLFLAAQSAATLTSAFVAPISNGLSPFGVAHQKCSFVTQVSAEPVEAADEPTIDEVPEVPEAEAVSEESSETEVAAVVEEDSSEETAEETTPEPAPKKDRITCFVGNLAFGTTDAEVRDLFAEYGKVELVSVPRDKATGRSRGFAFVDMSTKEELNACIEALNGREVSGRNIRVAETLPKDQVQKRKLSGDEGLDDGSKKIYVGNLPFETTVNDLTEFYKEYGEVKEVYIPSDINSGRPRGFAFVTMNADDVPKAIEATDGVEYQGRVLAVSEPLPRGKKAPPRKYADRTKLYVGNLSFYTSLETIQGLFEEYGDVYDCYMPADRETGASRGFAFVTMSPEAAASAMDETDGYELEGRIIRVNEAQPKFAGNTRSYDDEGDYDDAGDFADAGDGSYEEDESFNEEL